MKLPVDCRYAGMASFNFVPQEVDCCRVHGWLLGAEEPLCRSRPKESEVYRFIWHSSFDGNAVVSIGRNAEAIMLRWKYACFRVAAADDAPPVVALPAADWQGLQDCLNAARFWSLDSTDESLGLDGAQWLIEGRREDAYQAVARWSPARAIYDLGCLFFALAGVPLARVELY